jgi:hypothetical protein
VPVESARGKAKQRKNKDVTGTIIVKKCLFARGVIHPLVFIFASSHATRLITQVAAINA